MRALSTATVEVIYCMSPDWSEMRALKGRGLLTDTSVPNRAWLQGYIEPQDQDTVRVAVEQAIRHKTVFEQEHRVRRADGTIGWTLSRAVPLLDVRGNLREWIGAASDITERKHAELARQESERRLATVFEGLPLGVALLDTAGAVMLSNQEMHCYMPTGLLPSSDDTRYGRWRAYYPDGRRIECSEYAGARALRGEIVLPGIDFLYTRDDGTEIWTRVAAVPLRGSEGRVTGAVVMVADIDAAKRAEQQLRETDERRNEFLAMLAHELRNPLAPITNAVRLLEKDLTPERRRTVVEMVRRQSTHMARLVDDLLEVSRVTQGRIELKKERLLLAHALLPALEAARPLAREQGQALVFDVPVDIELEADPARLTQIVGNLLTNAVKYTPAGGHVRLSARALDRWVEIEVRDDGLGLDEALLPRVFELFAQGATTLDRSRGGLGLGLTLVQRLAQLHGGEAHAASRGPGQGSTFTVRLPHLQGAAAPVDAAPPTAPLRLTPTTLLVVDDNADAADSLALLLQMDGHEVRVARSGPQGLDMARQWRPRALLLDLGLPGLDGYAVAKSLRADPDTAGMAIVAVSGYGQDSDREKTRAAGFDGHLVKPVDLEEAYRALELALGLPCQAGSAAAQ